MRSVFLGEAQVQRAIRVMVHASLRVSVCATRVGEEPRRRKRRASLRARPRPGEDGTGKKKREGRTCRRAEGNSRGVARRHAALRAGSRGGTGVGRRGWGKCWMENTYLDKLSARERGMAPSLLSFETMLAGARAAPAGPIFEFLSRSPPSHPLGERPFRDNSPGVDLRVCATRARRLRTGTD